MNEKYLIGLDAGTTAIKGVIVDHLGNILATAGKEYNLEYPSRELCEVDPEVYWKSTCQVISDLLVKSKCDSKKITALAFSSQGETLICSDRAGKPLRKALVWLDNRSTYEAEIIKVAFGEEKVLGVTGQPEIIPTWTASKILWLKRNERSLFDKIFKFQLVEDHLVSRLTGKYFTNPSMATSTLYFDILQRKWWNDMTGFLGISHDRLPEIINSGGIAGELTENAARETGLDKSTLVVSGSYDHPAGALGSGNIKEGLISETTGTALAMCVTLNQPLLSKKLNIPCHCHVVENKYFLLPYGQTAGMVLRWFRDEFCGEDKRIAEQKNLNPYDILTKMATDIPAGSEGLTVLPHLMGAGSPEFDLNIRGVFAGISPGMKKGHFIRAIMEAVASIVTRNVESLHNFNIKVNEIRALGGGAASDLWNQMKADMTGIPYVTIKSTEAACTGAAILAGVGSGIFSDIEEGCRQLVQLNRKYIPDPGMKETYRQVFNRYVRLYEQMKGWPLNKN
jgi:xylulokinase